MNTYLSWALKEDLTIELPRIDHVPKIQAALTPQ